MRVPFDEYRVNPIGFVTDLKSSSYPLSGEQYAKKRVLASIYIKTIFTFLLEYLDFHELFCLKRWIIAPESASQI